MGPLFFLIVQARIAEPGKIFPLSGKVVVSFSILYFTKERLKKTENSDYLKRQNCIKYSSISIKSIALILRHVSAAKNIQHKEHSNSLWQLYNTLIVFFSQCAATSFISLECPPFFKSF
jgi:hypothetical protein